LVCGFELALGRRLEWLVVAQIDPGRVRLIVGIDGEQLDVAGVVMLGNRAWVLASTSAKCRPHDRPRLAKRPTVAHERTQLHCPNKIAVQIQITTHIGFYDVQLVERSQRGRCSRSSENHFEPRHALAHEDRSTGSVAQFDGERQRNPTRKDSITQIAEL
jgi:hypothetical protein